MIVSAGPDHAATVELFQQGEADHFMGKGHPGKGQDIISPAQQFFVQAEMSANNKMNCPVPVLLPLGQQPGKRLRINFTAATIEGHQEGSVTAIMKKLFRLLDSGVDGVMTDYPEKIRPLLDEWKAS